MDGLMRFKCTIITNNNNISEIYTVINQHLLIKFNAELDDKHNRELKTIKYIFFDIIYDIPTPKIILKF